MIYSENILICIAIPLLISLIFTDKNTRRFIAGFLTGMIVCLLSAYISGFVHYITGISQNDTAVYYSPLIEETMKLLPVLFYMFVFFPDDNRVFIVSLSIGLGFATFENCCYILTSGASEVTYILIRGMAAGVMHLVCALVLVLGLSMARRFKVLSLPSVVGAASLAMIFHGLYNLLVSEPGFSSYLGYFLPVATALALFFPYRLSTRRKVPGNL
ncbi:MAG: PrsW family intramembrane metalloprotease [Lachnospiraceae bacterium]|nr:PrsW family intramembrane metalloprotease [Lachnospiraceae bacterium]